MGQGKGKRAASQRSRGLEKRSWLRTLFSDWIGCAIAAIPPAAEAGRNSRFELSIPHGQPRERRFDSGEAIAA